MNEDSVRKQICEHIGCSNDTFYALAYQIYIYQAGQYSDMLPHYLQPHHEVILSRSAAFRQWFNIEKKVNDSYVLTLMERMETTRIRLTEFQYVELHKMYFEERHIYPNEVVLRLAIQDYKKRVSQIPTE